MALQQFTRDPQFKAHYLHHKDHPPRWVQSKAEKEYLEARQWRANYQHQVWPQLRYHLKYDVVIERRPDVEEFFKPNGDVDERARQKAIADRSRQRQRAIRQVASQAQADKLGPEWVLFHELPSEQARLALEAEEQAADRALFGGEIDEDFDDEPEQVVMGEPLRKTPRPARAAR